MATDWQVNVDLGWRIKFPAHTVTTSLRPDIVLLSDSDRHLIMLGLTVPRENTIEEAYERKRTKYQGLVEDWLRVGRMTKCLPTDVGSRGQSLC